MKMFYLVPLLAFYASSCGGQVNYNNYHASINQAESLFFVKDKQEESLQIYDRLLSQYEFVFVKDFFIAAQIACRCHDPKRLYRYLTACFKNGLTIDHLSLSPIFLSKGITKQNIKLLSVYDTYRKKYLAQIDLDYRAIIYQIFSEDQVDKSLPRDRYNETLRDHVDQLIGYINKKGFPSDKLIGIDDSSIKVKGRNLVQWYRKFCHDQGISPNEHIGYGEDYSLSSCAALYLLIHHPCSYQKISPYLATEIKRGNIHPRDVGLLYDNMIQMRKLSAGHMLACSPPGKYYYKLNFFCTYPENWRDNVSQIDSLRHTLNICSVRQDSIKKAKMASFGFHNKFGFWSCR